MEAGGALACQRDGAAAVVKSPELAGRLAPMSERRGSFAGGGPAQPGGLRPVTRARPLADLIGSTLDRACRKRGFAAADLVLDWPDIVGERYAGKVQPLRVEWPRAASDALEPDPRPATLVVQTDGATALFLAHDLDQVIERINGFFGWSAIGRIRILQRPLSPPRRVAPKPLRPLSAAEERDLAQRIAPLDGTRLGAALERLGRAVLARKR